MNEMNRNWIVFPIREMVLSAIDIRKKRFAGEMICTSWHSGAEQVRRVVDSSARKRLRDTMNRNKWLGFDYLRMCITSERDSWRHLHLSLGIANVSSKLYDIYVDENVD